MLPLFACQRAGELNLDRGVQVASMLRPADGRHPVSLQTEYLPVLRAFRNLEPDRAGDRRHLRFAAKHGRRDRDGDLRLEVVPFALEHRMRVRGQDSEETIQRRLAAAREEMSHYVEFDYVIVNEHFETAVAEMCAIFTASRLRRPLQDLRHAELIQALLHAGA